MTAVTESIEQTLAKMMSERREKRQGLIENGDHPYRNDLSPSHQCQQVRELYAGTMPEEKKPGIHPVDGTLISLAGRVMARRGFGKTVFLPLRDRSGELQLYLNIDETAKDDFENVLPKLDVGDIVWAEGVVFWTKRGELSLLSKKFKIVTKTLRPLPDKWHGLTDVETRYRQRYLDLIVNNEVREVFKKRARIVAGIRSYFDDKDFLEVETPMMHPMIGGAAARPFETHHNALNMPLFMRIAPELYLKRLLVGGFERVYEINRNFRNEGLSRQHNPEFTMLEFYWAYAQYGDLMELTEKLVNSLARDVIGKNTVHWDGHDIELNKPWKRISVLEAVSRLDGMDEHIFDDPIKAAEKACAHGVDPHVVFQVLCAGCPEGEDPSKNTEWLEGFKKGADRAEIASTICATYESPIKKRTQAGHLAYLIFEEKIESTLIQPTFLTGFPLAVSPLARKSDSDPAYCDRFELFVAGKEIANGFSELNDPDDQRSRFEAQIRAKAHGAAETMDYDDDYCRALEFGMPPAAGEGIGIDRLVMMLTGQDSIRDVILFPLMRS